ncbi:acyltransferase [Fibrobacter sp. HC4]|uniref:acyltransferase family protein n=1 Tax=Fibrobacter sp. HC4 TaxID=3239812 RepID=UPI0020188509|nr:acyltransferase [Fibrobacter succinogenes]MCL4101208.1 hypothetical protein [Fibrobacter succinogenes]
MPKKRIVGLDIFRVLAVFIVFLFHAQLFLKCDFGPADSVIQMGAVFMTGFFMLSGFVLYLTHSQTNLMQVTTLKKFYFKRAIGILPLYYFFALLFIVTLGQESLKENLILAPVEILGLQSTFSSIFTVSHNDGTWFISCLLICYLLFPLMQEVAKQISSRAKILIIAFCGVALCWAPVIVHFYHTASIYENPFYRGLEFTIGVMLCSLRNDAIADKFKFLQQWKFFAAEFLLYAVAVTAALKIGIPGNYMLFDFIALPAFAAMLWSLSGVKSEALENSKILQFACKISYAFFLAQSFCWIPVFKFQELTGINNGFLNFAISFIVCILVSAAMHILVERPATKKLTKILQ